MFASLFVPRFGLQAVLRQEPELRGQRVALINAALPPEVTEISPEAEACGVCHGMTSAQAQGRCHDLVFRVPGEGLLQSARDCLLQCGGMFSPWIEETAHGIVTLEWRAWQREPGAVLTEEQMAQLEAALHKAVRWLEQIGFQASAGAAENPDLAVLAARCARPVLVLAKDFAAEFLAPLPIHVLMEEGIFVGSVSPRSGNDGSLRDGELAAAIPKPDARAEQRERAMDVLRRWGVRTLGQLVALPRAQLIERLGPEADHLRVRALGCSERLLKLVRVPERFAEMHEFDHEVETLEPLLFLLRRFVEQLCARLEQVHRVVTILRLRLCFDRNEPHERELKVPSPTAEVEVLFRMLSTHLEGVTAESPVVSLELEVVPTAQQRSQFDLFSSRLRDPNQFYETLAQLSALLGNGRVGSPVLLDSHRPDTYELVLPKFDDPPLAELGEPSTEGLPLRRFRPPIAARVYPSSGGFPAYIESPVVSGMVQGCRGPWLSSGEWWTVVTWVRVEWDVHLPDGIYRLVQQAIGEFLEGRYE